MTYEKLTNAILYILHKLKDVSIVDKDTHKAITEEIMEEYASNKKELNKLHKEAGK